MMTEVMMIRVSHGTSRANVPTDRADRVLVKTGVVNEAFSGWSSRWVILHASADRAGVPAQEGYSVNG